MSASSSNTAASSVPSTRDPEVEQFITTNLQSTIDFLKAVQARFPTDQSDVYPQFQKVFAEFQDSKLVPILTSKIHVFPR